MNRFEEIYSEHYRSMYHVSVKIVGNRSEVKDIVQEVFISLFEKLQNRKEIRNPKGWLYRTTCNKSIDFLRRQRHFGDVGSLKDLKNEDESPEEEDVRSTINLAL